MVEQYNCYGSDIRGGEMRPEEDGQWVRYSDYAALEAQLAGAKAENERLKRERNFWRSQHDERTRQLGMSDTEATPPAPKVTATHRHKKRGSEYSVLGQAQVQCSDCLTDYEVVTVYVGTDGQMWVRRKSEFEDGRFETLTAAQEAGKP